MPDTVPGTNRGPDLKTVFEKKGLSTSLASALEVQWGFGATVMVSSPTSRSLPENDLLEPEERFFALPAPDTGFAQKRRQSATVLSPGETNQVTVRLQRKAKSPIAHY
jgi:hypothetical protein